MKTSITLSDDLFQRLKARAEVDATSLSGLLALAAERYLAPPEIVSVPAEPMTTIHPPPSILRQTPQGNARVSELTTPLPSFWDRHQVWGSEAEKKRK